MAIYLTEAQISELLTMEDTLTVLEELFAARSRGEIVNRPRVRLPITAGAYNVVDDQPVQHRELGDILASLLEVAPPRLPPLWLTRLAGSLGRPRRAPRSRSCCTPLTDPAWWRSWVVGGSAVCGPVG